MRVLRSLTRPEGPGCFSNVAEGGGIRPAVGSQIGVYSDLNVRMSAAADHDAPPAVGCKRV